MEEILFRGRKHQLMTKLRVWASENRITLYGKVSKTGTKRFMQNGSTRKGTKLYCIDDDGIYSWGGIHKGWILEEDVK